MVVGGTIHKLGSQSRPLLLGTQELCSSSFKLCDRGSRSWLLCQCGFENWTFHVMSDLPPHPKSGTQEKCGSPMVTSTLRSYKKVESNS